ncbi:MAG: hypothetical protein IKA36_05760 [Clostridia bacterium]|nr:hypothetical protein [Clostridia bacterium]
MEQESKYIYPVEELDKLIAQIEQGIAPMVNDQILLEVRLRKKELEYELFDDVDDIDDADTIAHREMLKKHLENKKREASKKDVLTINLTDEQRAQLEDDMRFSIVRPNPLSIYNKSDEELYSSAEKKVIAQRLARIRNCYYNQTDYKNAIEIIMSAIKYAIDNEYPWLPRKEVIKMVNEGRIKFTFCNIPKLYVDYRTQITDPNILKGVVTGEVTLKDKNDVTPVSNRNKGKGVDYPYNILTQSEYDEMLKYHKMGYDTPASTLINAAAKSSIYQFTMPYNNNWVVGNNSDNNNNEPIYFDWMREGAGEEYFNLMYGDKNTNNLTDLINIVNENNDRELSQNVKMNMTSFMNNLKRSFGTSDTHYQRPDVHISSSLQVNPEAVKIEEGIMNALRMNNPNL